MAGFGRQHEYRIGRALVVAALVVVVGGAFFPVGILRLFGRRAPIDGAENSARFDPWIRLIPADRGSVDTQSEQVPTRIIFHRVSSPVPEQLQKEDRRTWTFDPTTRFRTVSGLAEPTAPAVPDSLQLHADFLHSLRLGNMQAALAMLDTTQAGVARRQFAETDRWVNRYLGPAWEAEGKAGRQADLWWRVVGEVEAEGSH